MKSIITLILCVFAFACSNAQVVYTDVNPDQVITSSIITTYNFDLDNDGVIDFVFQESTSFVNCRSGSTSTCIATITPANADNAIMTDGTNLALALTDSSTIDSDSLWSASSQAVTLFVSNIGLCIVSNSSKGHWLKNVPDKYVGLRLVKNGNTYYGWVRLTCTRVSLGSLYYATTLKDYAYSSMPGQHVLTGEGASASVHNAPSIQWQKSFGGSNDDYPNSIQQTTDGGYIITGLSNSTDGDVTGNYTKYDTWVIKIDNSGNIQWQKILDGGDPVNNYSGGSSCIKQTSDGGYIAAGSVGIIKLSGSGTIQWQSDLRYTGRAVNSIQQTMEGGYIVAGSAASNAGNHGGYDYDIIKLSSTGDTQWEKSLGGSGDEEANSIQQTADGGYIVAGISNSTDGDVSGNHGSDDYWIVKLDGSGTIQWQKSLGGSSIDYAISIQQTNEGGYIVAGYSGSYDGDITGYRGSVSTGNYNAWLAKLNNSGTIEWQKCFGGSDNDRAFFIQQTSDGGYIVAGVSASIDGDADIDKCGNHGSDDYWVLKLNNNGNMQWQKSLGGSSDDATGCIQQTADGGYIVAGGSASNDGDVTGNHGSVDYWIVKLGADFTLPLQLISFTGTLENNIAKLNWHSGTEENFKQFELEKSTDGKNFTKIATIAAKGSNSDYTYNTPQKESIAFYRFKITDIDAKFTYSKVIPLTRSGASVSIKISPIPAHDAVTIAGAENFTSVQFIDASGRIVKQFGKMPDNLFPIADLTKGIYFIRLVSGSDSRIFKIIKE